MKRLRESKNLPILIKKVEKNTVSEGKYSHCLVNKNNEHVCYPHYKAISKIIEINADMLDNIINIHNV